MVAVDETPAVWLSSLDVREDLRGRGIGTAVVRELKRLAGARPVRCFVLAEDPANTQRLAAWYRREGVECA